MTSARLPSSTIAIDRMSRCRSTRTGIFVVHLFVASILISLLSSCAAPNIGGETIYAGQIYRGDPVNYLVSGSATPRNVVTVVVGNPYGVPQEGFATTVAASMSASVSDIGARFVVLGGEPVRPGISAIAAFNPVPNATSAGLCRTKGNAQTIPSTGDVQITMVLCIQDDPISFVSGKLARDKGPRTKAFASMVKRMTDRLLGIGSSPTRLRPD